MNKVCAMYLRKSRTDMQAEARGEGNVLDRHRRFGPNANLPFFGGEALR